MRAPNFRSRFGRLLPVALALVLAAAIVGPALADTGADYAIPSGWFYTQTGGGQGQGFAVRDTGTDANGKTIKFWSEFKRLGGISTLGYPVGQPYSGSDGFTYQPFQRGVLQWRPESSSSVLSNTFQVLQANGKDDWLLNAKGVPAPIADDGSVGDYAKAVTTRLGWLTNASVKAKFMANPSPATISGWNQDRAIELYGLPMSQPEKHGPFISQRFQRIAFQLWVEDVAGMPAKGTVVGILGGDLLKEAGLLPASAIQPLGPNAAAPINPVPTATPTNPVPTAAPEQPTATPVPAPAAGSYSYHVASISGAPNCGTTYIRAFVRDSSGHGQNGMTIKSWNDWGNESIASTNQYQGNDGHWDRVIGSGVQAGSWQLMLIDGQGHQASDIATVNFTGSCDANAGNVQEAEVIIQAN